MFALQARDKELHTICPKTNSILPLPPQRETEHLRINQLCLDTVAGTCQGCQVVLGLWWCVQCSQRQSRAMPRKVAKAAAGNPGTFSCRKMSASPWTMLFILSCRADLRYLLAHRPGNTATNRLNFIVDESQYNKQRSGLPRVMTSFAEHRPVRTRAAGHRHTQSIAPHSTSM